AFDTAVAVYAPGGACPPSTAPIACNDNAPLGAYWFGLPVSQATFYATASQTYKIRVGGVNGAFGSGTLRIIGPNPAAGFCPSSNSPTCQRVFMLSGNGNGTPWAWSITKECCINAQNLNVAGVSGAPGVVATQFVNSINAWSTAHS